MTNRDIVEKYSYDAWVKGDLSVIDSLFADHFVTHDHHAPGPDREHYKHYIRAHLEAIDRHQTRMNDVLADGDRVATRWTVSGVLKKDLMGLQASGQEVVLSGIAIYRLADGLIVEKWSEVSLLEV